MASANKRPHMFSRCPLQFYLTTYIVTSSIVIACRFGWWILKTPQDLYNVCNMVVTYVKNMHKFKKYILRPGHSFFKQLKIFIEKVYQ